MFLFPSPSCLHNMLEFYCYAFHKSPKRCLGYKEWHLSFTYFVCGSVQVQEIWVVIDASFFQVAKLHEGRGCLISPHTSILGTYHKDRDIIVVQNICTERNRGHMGYKLPKSNRHQVAGTGFGSQLSPCWAAPGSWTSFLDWLGLWIASTNWGN